MKRMIYQVKVGIVPPFYEFCIQSVADYCKKYGIDHIVETQAKLKIVPKNSQRSKEAVDRLGYLPIYEKEVAFEYFDRYDQIAIIDADIYVKPTSPNIFEQLTTNEAFAGVIERDMPLTPQYVKKIYGYSTGQYQRLDDVDWKWSKTHGAEFYNMGLMVMTRNILPYLNGETPSQFIQRPEFERFVNGEGKWRWSTDQTLLNYWVKKSQMPVTNLLWKWNALFKGVTDDMLLQSYFVHFFLSNNLPQKGAEIPNIVKDLTLSNGIREYK